MLIQIVKGRWHSFLVLSKLFPELIVVVIVGGLLLLFLVKRFRLLLGVVGFPLPRVIHVD